MDRSQVAEVVLSLALPGERAARAASDFVRRPFFMFRIAIAGLLRIFAMVPLFALISAPFADHGYRWAPEWIAGIGILAWLVRCGMWLARYQPGSALASCIAVILLGWIWIAIVHTTPPASATDFVMGGVHDLLLISGALWARYRDVRQTWRVARA